MTQQEIIAEVHRNCTSSVPLTEIIRRIGNVISLEGETNVPAILGRLEPASIAYVHAYPDDISDGPWDL